MGKNGAKLPASRLAHQFNKTGGSGNHTNLFSAFPKEIKLFLNSAIKLEAGEYPVIVCFFDKENWTLLTTKRLVGVYETQSPLEVTLEHLSDVSIPDGHQWEVGGKKNMSRLVVETEEGCRHELRLEPGKPFFGWWNVLRIVAR